MKKKMLYILLTLFAFTQHVYASYHCDLANKISNVHLQHVKKKYNLNLVGYGGAMMDKVEEIYMLYSSPGHYNLDETRNLVLTCSIDLVNLFNQSKKIRPYLANYPFSINNINYTINFESASKHPNIEYVGAVILAGDKVSYCIWENRDLKPILTETIDEAMEKWTAWKARVDTVDSSGHSGHSGR